MSPPVTLILSILSALPQEVVAITSAFATVKSVLSAPDQATIAALLAALNTRTDADVAQLDRTRQPPRPACRAETEVNPRPPRAARTVAWICAGLVAGPGAALAGDPLSSLAARGPLQATDQLPVLPAECAAPGVDHGGRGIGLRPQLSAGPPLRRRA